MVFLHGLVLNEAYQNSREKLSFLKHSARHVLICCWFLWVWLKLLKKAKLSWGLGRSWREESAGYSTPDPELAALEAQRTTGLVKNFKKEKQKTTFLGSKRGFWSRSENVLICAVNDQN